VARDHYLAAALLGRFSASNTLPARDRRLFVARHGRNISTARASSFGYVNGLYDVERSGSTDSQPGHAATSVDQHVAGYESALPFVLDQLKASEPIALKPWLRTAVPFVAAAFVRGPDFNKRFERRSFVEATAGSVSPDNTNNARSIELSLLLAPVMAARWVIFHGASLETPFIINNLGITPSADGADRGFVIPISNYTAIGIFPRSTGTVAIYRSGWVPVIEHRVIDSIMVTDCNQCTAAVATEWIAGRNQRILEDNIQFIKADESQLTQAMEGWPITYRSLVSHDREWHRLVSATAADLSPSELPNLQEVVPAKLAADWCPPVILRINMLEMPTGLSLAGRTIRLKLDTPADYGKYFITPGD